MCAALVTIIIIGTSGMVVIIIGNCYLQGNGVVQDVQRAVHFYQLAADQGQDDSNYI